MPATNQFFAFVGNYGKSLPRGIHRLRYDPAKPSLSAEGLAAPAENPNFVIIHPNRRFLYAVTATKIASYPGAVEAYAIHPATGALTFLNRQPSGGDNPAHLALDPTGKLLVVANYSGGSIAAFPVADDGRLANASAVIQHHGSSVNPDRQREPHPHEVTFDPAGQYVVVPDLGMDQLLRYRVNVPAGSLTPDGAATVPPGSGPRHLAFGPTGRFMYVINELSCTLSVLTYDPAGGPMSEVQTLAVWPEKKGASGAEIELHPNGRYIYASNRGQDSIAVCEIEPSSGKLRLLHTHPTGGRTPRHFCIDPTARFILASNMDSNSVVLLNIDSATGRLSDTNIQLATEAPCCLAFVPTQPAA